ncbi:GtrA family protein [Blastococcus brunescens]|uniref:GtrA family protein n=1 Tax=Blastococcus brunescens TaxID=1564165 RepID=A0ABZ1AZJ7_9ACTN|nr:GtrA family protein [Blastococcus sp. BMG 8361]WRL62911.1 GtrA family protein [Blastococcus sp. BMG 8361]
MQWAESIRVRMGTTWRLLLKEVSAFGVVGIACFAIDIVLFQLLYAHVGLGAVTAKFLATLVSMTVAYVGHRYWSFSHRARTGLRREYLLFAAVNGATLALNLGIVALVRYPSARRAPWSSRWRTSPASPPAPSSGTSPTAAGCSRPPTWRRRRRPATPPPRARPGPPGRRRAPRTERYLTALDRRTPLDGGRRGAPDGWTDVRDRCATSHAHLPCTG